MSNSGQLDPTCPQERRALHEIERCGGYLLFRHYLDHDTCRLHAARFCKFHLLCPLCAVRRGAKALEAYLKRYEVVRGADAALRPFLVTLTVKDGPDLAERFLHLAKSFRHLAKRRTRRDQQWSEWAKVKGAVWSYEVKRGSGSGQWHPHLHAIVLGHESIYVEALADEWRGITGDSFIVDVRPIEAGDLVGGFCEVFKYAVKFSDMEPADTAHAWRTIRGRRLIDSAGLLRGVEIPDSLLDEALDGPFVDLLFVFLANRRRYSYAAAWSSKLLRSGAVEARSAC